MFLRMNSTVFEDLINAPEPNNDEISQDTEISFLMMMFIFHYPSLQMMVTI